MTPPVLLVIYNRPDLTRAVFERIRVARPARLYIAADGPRPGLTADNENCKAARAVVEDIDWPCSVERLFREQNLGCRRGMSAAIDWFFDNESEGVIVEDDCLVSSSFFHYCAELLDRFREDARIMSVSGGNYQQGRSVSAHSYYFSRYSHCWGWATWRRAWKLYDRDMELWPEFRSAGGLDAWSGGHEEFVSYWTEIFDLAAAGEIDSWAYRWTFSCWAHGGLSCIPEENLVQNIGFDERATHTLDANTWLTTLRPQELAFPLKHPPYVFRSVAADVFTDKVCYNIDYSSDSTSHRFRRSVSKLLSAGSNLFRLR